MKFLIAASFLCLALVGQIQGGSLRGLAVRMPHQVYGAPLPESEIPSVPLPEDNETVVVEKVEEPAVSKPSSEYGAPAVEAEVERIPFEHSLPHIETQVNFYLPPKPEIHLEPGLPALPEAPVVPVEVPIPEVHNTYLPPSNEYLPPATPKPELPLLEPGLPTLPEAPVVPVVPEVHNTYLPPVEKIETTPAPVVIEEPHTPSEVYGPPMVEEPKPSDVYGPPATPEIVELPALPEVPEIPVEEEKSSGYHYAPPVGLPVLELPKVTVPQKPHVLYTAPTKVHVESHFIDIPRVVKTEQVLVQPALPVKHEGYHYQVPTKDFPTPVGIPSLVSHSEFTENHASSASSSSLHVNKYVVPTRVHVQPTITHDTVLVEDLQPIGPGFTVQSIHSGSAHKTSVGSFNHQVSVVSNELPRFPSFSAAW